MKKETPNFGDEYRQEKKLLIHAKISKIRWQADLYDSAQIDVDYCCDEIKKQAGEFFPQNSNIPAGGRDSANFLKMMHKGKPVDECPFCGARVEVVRE